jgi:hypothetical protein
MSALALKPRGSREHKKGLAKWDPKCNGKIRHMYQRNISLQLLYPIVNKKKATLTISQHKTTETQPNEGSGVRCSGTQILTRRTSWLVFAAVEPWAVYALERCLFPENLSSPYTTVYVSNIREQQGRHGLASEKRPKKPSSTTLETKLTFGKNGRIPMGPDCFGCSAHCL